jgi:RES domain-containing protein
MRVWRLVRRPYADLSGIGAASYPGRWNAARQRVVYTAEHPALAVLEVRVHLGLDLDLIPPDYVLMAIELGRSPIETYTGPGTGRAAKIFGAAWLREQRTAVLSVPSILVPNTRNYLINPSHPRAAQIKIIGLHAFQFDPRILRGAPVTAK